MKLFSMFRSKPKSAPPTDDNYLCLQTVSSVTEGEDDLGEFEMQILGERLLDDDAQKWALGLLVLVIPIVIWSENANLSCTLLSSEEKLAPTHCKHLIGDTSQLRLPNFCVKTCLSARMVMFYIFLMGGMVLQGVVVILNHGGCQKWMRLKVSFDVQNETDQISEDLDAKINEELDSKFKRMFKNTLMKIKETLTQKLRKGSTHQSDKSLIHGRVAGIVSRLCTFLSAGEVIFIVTTSFSVYPSFFECHGQDRIWFGPHLNIHHLLGHAISFAMLSMIFYLQWQAKWTLQIKCMNLDANARMKRLMLRRQFTASWYPREILDERFKLFGNAFMRQLISVNHNGYHDKPEKAFKRMTWGNEVVFHFKKQRLIWDKLPDNKHRVASIVGLLGGGSMLICSSLECWACVQGFVAPANSTVLDIEYRMFLYGSCGRHSGIGTAAQVGGALAIISFFLQILIVYLTDPKFNGGQKLYRASQNILKEEGEHFDNAVLDYENASDVAWREQLWLCVLDAATGTRAIQAPGKYAIAGMELPEFYSFVWVVDVKDLEGSRRTVQTAPSHKAEGGEQNRDAPAYIHGTDGVVEKIMNGDDATVPRNQWKQSCQPRKVKLVDTREDSVEILYERMRGLVREDYSLPTLGISIEMAPGEHVIQMVPMQFSAGRLHVWLNLGSKLAWEKVSASLSFVAFFLGALDVAYFFLHPKGTILSACDDVMNDDCLYLHLDSKFDSDVAFRRSLGWIMAANGAVLALLSCLCLRVAHQMEARHEWTADIYEYIAALFYSFSVAFDIVSFIARSLWRHARAFCKESKWCCCCQDEIDPDAAEKMKGLLHEEAMGSQVSIDSDR